MKLEDVLEPGAVLLDVTVADKRAAIARAATELSRSAGIPREAIEAALFSREALGSTGVGGGIAVPHARMHSLRHTHAVFLRLAAPIPFDAIDGAPVDLVCAVVAQDDPGSALLTAVSGLSRAMRNATKVAELRAAGDAATARGVLLSGG